MADEDVEVVVGQFEAVNRRDFVAAMDAYTEDVELVAAFGGPDDGTYSGVEAVGRWFGDWFRSFSGGYHFELIQTIDAGEGRVFLAARHTARGRHSGIELAVDLFYAYLVRDGKVARAELYGDRTPALRAAGLADDT